MRFARAVLLTDRTPEWTIPDGIEVANIGPLPSRDAYSDFVLKRLLPHVATKHVLLVQWDGYVVNPAAWEPAFLECDYIGAPWFWQPEGFRVGNGGFSLRSRRLLVALQDPRIVLKDAEDLTIGHAFRTLLETEFSIRFADEPLAERFASSGPSDRSTVRVSRAAQLRAHRRRRRAAALAPNFSDAIAKSLQMARSFAMQWP
jgi:hypothetical protein